MNVDFDGKALVDAIMFSAISQGEDGKKNAKLLQVFMKYGLSIMDALALMAEVSAVIEQFEETDEEHGEACG